MNKSIVVVAAFLCALPGAVQASCHPNCPAPTGASGGGLSLADTAASVVVRASKAEAEEYSEWQKHLHVTFALSRHQKNSNDRSRKHADEDCQDGEAPA